MTETNKSVFPHTLINLNCRVYFCLKDKKKGKNYPRTPQSLQTHRKDSPFYVMVMCPKKSVQKMFLGIEYPFKVPALTNFAHLVHHF